MTVTELFLKGSRNPRYVFQELLSSVVTIQKQLLDTHFLKQTWQNSVNLQEEVTATGNNAYVKGVIKITACYQPQASEKSAQVGKYLDTAL